jgi:hypothetical protein
VSYSHTDRSLAKTITKRLSEAGLAVWDLNSVSPGENWAAKAGKALAESDAVVVLLSPTAVNTPSVRHEIEYALSNRRFENRLLPVVVKGGVEVPWVLRRLPTVDLADEGEDRVVAKVKEMLEAGR